MKCRLYPNKTQMKQIDDWILEAQKEANCLLYDLLSNSDCQKEKTSKSFGTSHWAEWGKVKKSDHYKSVYNKNGKTQTIPGGVVSNKSAGIVANMKQASMVTKIVNGKPTQIEYPIEMWGQELTMQDGTKRKIGPSYYSKKRPRRSIGYQTSRSNIRETDNPNVYKVRLKSESVDIGWIKIRGVNLDLRFDGDETKTFLDWIHEKHPKTQLQPTIRVIKNPDNTYWIVFSLQNVLKPFFADGNKIPALGIDVGEIDIASLSDGMKYDNIFDHNPKISRNMEAKKELDKKLSRSWGWRNPEFRAAYQKDKTITPSKRYTRLDLKHKQVSAAIARQRADYYNKVTADIISKADMIAIESLSVKEMFQSQDKEDAVES